MNLISPMEFEPHVVKVQTVSPKRIYDLGLQVISLITENMDLRRNQRPTSSDMIWSILADWANKENLSFQSTEDLYNILEPILREHYVKLP